MALTKLLAFGTSLLTVSSLLAAPSHSAPLTRGHAHNDYEHTRPLLDALEQGFCSVEADIHLVDGELLVAHDRTAVKAGRTLDNLYLKPLAERAAQNGGRVYPNGPTVILLVDIKSAAEPTYAALKPLLERYSKALTRFTPDGIQTNAVTIILSGNRPRTVLENEPNRYAALDGRPEDLETNPPNTLIPLISENWAKLFHWRGLGPFPPNEQAKLVQIVRKTHEQKRQIRFWGAPDLPVAWKALLEAKVDLINTDRLADLRQFMDGRR